MKTFFAYLVSRDVLIDFLTITMWVIIAVTMLIIYAKRSDKFTEKTKTTFKLFVILAFSWIIGEAHFMLKYAFATDISPLNGNVGQIVTCIITFLLMESNYDKWGNALKGKHSMALIIGLYAFAAIILHVKGQGGDPYASLWYYSEYAVCFIFLTLALIVGIGRLVRGDLTTAYCKSFFVYVVFIFLASAWGSFNFFLAAITGHGIENKIAIQIMYVFSTAAAFFVLVPNVFLLMKKA